MQRDYSYEQNMMLQNFLFRSVVGKVLIRAAGPASGNSLDHPPNGGAGAVSLNHTPRGGSEDGVGYTPELAPASDGPKVGRWHETTIEILV